MIIKITIMIPSFSLHAVPSIGTAADGDFSESVALGLSALVALSHHSVRRNRNIFYSGFLPLFAAVPSVAICSTMLVMRTGAALGIPGGGKKDAQASADAARRFLGLGS